MKNKVTHKNKLQETLNQMAVKGLQADAAQVKKDMCAQFADPRECGREYVVNASDAGATHCIVRGTKKDGIITLEFIDDGCGMDRQGVLDFFNVYRSGKDHPNSKSVGRHGIGKLSVAAIPGQCGFEMMTSTGEETWQVKTGSLLDEKPIKIVQQETIPTSGTTFRISFKSKNALKNEMEAYKNILEKYVCFLPMMVQVWIPENEDDDSEQFPEFINKEWPGNGITYYKTYQRTIHGNEASIVLGIGATTNVLYQNNVMITGKYNLFAHGETDPVVIPGLAILVDSPAFELPFGRHCLSNENLLNDIVRLVKNSLVPDFYSELLYVYKNGDLKNFHFSNYNFLLMTSALIFQGGTGNKPWLNTPVLKCVNQKAVSFNDVSKAVAAGQSVYLADPKLNGIDFSVFNGPVLESDQIGYCGKVLLRKFEKKMVDLTVDTLIMEKPGGSRGELNKTEMEFERQLGFRPELLARRKESRPGRQSDKVGDSFDFDLDKENTKQITKEVKSANLELENIRWRVSKLVERDGVTPCTTHLYLYSNHTITLNLYHPQVKQLVHLTRVNPQLAGHWAMALCLLDEKNILPHISAETREDLIMLDAMIRANDHKSSNGLDKKGNDAFSDLLFRFGDNDLN